MSDWIPAPKIENALILFISLPSDHPEGEDLQSVLPMDLLRAIASQEQLTPYLFYDPPERGDDLDDALGSLAASFALAAQLPGCLGGQMFAACRRVFSRATVKKAVVVANPCNGLHITQLLHVFDALEITEIVVLINDPEIIAGFTALDADIFQSVDWEQKDLGKELNQYASHAAKQIRVL